jgi:hypothetical protein
MLLMYYFGKQVEQIEKKMLFPIKIPVSEVKIQVPKSNIKTMSICFSKKLSITILLFENIWHLILEQERGLAKFQGVTE